MSERRRIAAVVLSVSSLLLVPERGASENDDLLIDVRCGLKCKYGFENWRKDIGERRKQGYSCTVRLHSIPSAATRIGRFKSWFGFGDNWYQCVKIPEAFSEEREKFEALAVKEQREIATMSAEDQDKKAAELGIRKTKEIDLSGRSVEELEELRRD